MQSRAEPTENRPTPVVVLAPAGDLDLASAPDLIAAVAAELATDRSDAVAIDLAEVGFIDSTGLRALLDCKRSCESSGRRLILARMGSAVGRMMDVVALRDRFEIVDELASVAPGPA